MWREFARSEVYGVGAISVGCNATFLEERNPRKRGKEKPSALWKGAEGVGCELLRAMAIRLWFSR